MDILLLIVDYSPSLVREYMMQVIYLLFLYWPQYVKGILVYVFGERDSVTRLNFFEDLYISLLSVYRLC